MTAPLRSSYGGHFETARLPLENGADKDFAAHGGETAMLIASTAWRADMVRLLLNACAGLNSRDANVTALRRACQE